MGLLRNIWSVNLRWSAVVLVLFFLTAIFSSFLASNNEGRLIPSPIPYDSKYLDADNAAYVSPFASQDVPSLYKRHWLGTDDLGRDVLAGIINGARTAFWVAFLSLLIALMIGIPIGLSTGYYGNQFKVGILESVIITFFALLMFYYLIYFSSSAWFVAIALILFVGFKSALSLMLDRFLPNRKKWTLPLDDIVTKLLEIFKSIPTLIILILLLGTIGNPGIISIAVCLGCLFWTRIARYIRAEILAIRESEFIIAQKAMGSDDLSIIFKHCLPKALPPVMVSIIFLAATAILMEATLSFLGLGLPVEEVSWGSMLNESRKYLGAWWMALFPGICLFLVIAALGSESLYWSEKLNPKVLEK
jgi:peptide/nickel transport system permease protein